MATNFHAATLQAEEDGIKKMEQEGMASKDVSLKDIISLWVTNIILTYGDPEKYANLQVPKH